MQQCRLVGSTIRPERATLLPGLAEARLMRDRVLDNQRFDPLGVSPSPCESRPRPP